MGEFWLKTGKFNSLSKITWKIQRKFESAGHPENALNRQTSIELTPYFIFIEVRIYPVIYFFCHAKLFPLSSPFFYSIFLFPIYILLLIPLLLSFECSSACLIHYTKYHQAYSRKRSVSREEVIHWFLFLVSVKNWIYSCLCMHKVICLIQS